MREPCIVSGLKVSNLTSVYKSLYDLPSAVAIRNISAGFITSILGNTSGNNDILTFNPGRGLLYKSLLKKYFENGRLRLLGVETDNYFLQQFKEDFPGDYMDALVPRTVDPGHSSVFFAENIAKDLDFPFDSFNFIEMSFSLSSFMFREDIEEFLRRILKLLRKGGYFIMSDLDSCVGSYIEARMRVYKNFYKEMSFNVSEGFVTCVKNKKRQLPFLDINNIFFDNNFLRNLYNSKFVFFEKEVSVSTLPESADMIVAESEIVRRGLRFYRTKEEWKDIVAGVFGQDTNILLTSPDDIKKRYPEVKDFPFILVAVKN